MASMEKFSIDARKTDFKAYATRITLLLTSLERLIIIEKKDLCLI